MWNNLDIQVRNSLNIKQFKNKLNSGLSKVPKQFYAGERKYNIYHARQRNGCSSLYNDLYNNHVAESPTCTCQVEAEDAYHYFFSCRKFTRQRDILNDELSNININLSVLLFGSETLTNNENTRIFTAVQKFIKCTKRFEPP